MKRRGQGIGKTRTELALEGKLATLDEMSYPDWRERLERAEKDSKAGNFITLEEFIEKTRKRRAKRGKRKLSRKM